MRRLRAEGIPARLSHHAGTFPHNYVSYWASREEDRLGLDAPAGSILVPISSEIAAEMDREVLSLLASALRRAVEVAIEVAEGSARVHLDSLPP